MSSSKSIQTRPEFKMTIVLKSDAHQIQENVTNENQMYEIFKLLHDFDLTDIFFSIIDLS